MEFFTLYHKEPFLYTVQLLSGGRIVRPWAPIANGLNWMNLCDEVGLEKSLRLAKLNGIAGVMSDGMGYYRKDEEYCIFVLSVLKILSVESVYN